MRELTPEQCKSYLEQAVEKPLLLDVREPWEYEIVKLENSRLIPMHSIPQHVDTLDPEQETIVICHHGIRSRQVAGFLEGLGFSRLINLRGGIDAWARETDPQLATY